VASSESAKTVVVLWTSMPLAVLALALAVVPLVGRVRPEAPGGLVRVLVGNPPRRPPAFQPRRRYRERIDAAWGSSATVVLSHTQVLHGDGGVGKSQLARECYEGSDAQVKVWVDASSIDGIVTACSRAATAVGREHMGVDAAETNAVVLAEAFRQWLRTATSWLVVFDDLDVEPDALERWWPSGPGQVLVTTRRDDIGYEVFFRVDDVVDLDVFSADEAETYVAERLAPYTATMPAGALDEVGALVQALGYHPVALNQATAVAIDEKLTTAGYLARFCDRTRTLSDVLAQADIAYDRRTVAATWSIALDRAATHCDHAGAMAVLVSVAHPTATPRCLFTTAAARRYLCDHGEPDADAALRALERVALVRLGPQAWDPVAVHALAQRAIGDLAADRSGAIVALADAAVDVWPDSNLDLVEGPQLRSVVEHLWSVGEPALLADGIHAALFRAGRSVAQSGAVKEAVVYHKALLVASRRAMGPDHRDTLRAWNHFAWWLGETGDTFGAVRELEQLLTEYRGTHGDDHHDIMLARNELAYYLAEAGDVRNAVEFLDTVLADRVRTLGPDDPETLVTRSYHARLRGKAGDALGAVHELEQVLAATIAVLGPDHPRTLSVRQHAAELRAKSGDVPRALRDLQAVRADRVRVLGRDHPGTLKTRRSIARWHGEAGDLARAVPEMEAVLADTVRIMGKDHPATLKTRGILAGWRGRAGDPAAAVRELDGLLADSTRVFGRDHPEILTTRHHLAWWTGEAGDPAGAVRELADVLRDAVDVFGRDHRETLTIRYRLAWWTGEAGDAPTAVDQLWSVLADRLHVLGGTDPQTTATREAITHWSATACRDHRGQRFASRST